jgi:glycosyltransferase involved in cell wall biosynthesis
MSVILFVHQAAELYGSDKVLLYLVEGIVAQGRYQPVVVVPEEGPLIDVLRRAGAEVHVATVAKIRRSAFTPSGLLKLVAQTWRARAELHRIVAGRRVAVVHSNTVAVLGGAAYAKWHRVPHLWHVHEIIESPRVVSQGFPWLIRTLADHVVSNSTLTQAWLLRWQPALKARSRVVFNGLPEQGPVDPADAARFRTSLGLNPGDVLAVLAGRLNSWKGQGLLLDALAVLQAAGDAPNLKVAIVGDTPPEQPHWRHLLEEQVRTLKLGDRVHFVPFVEDIRPVWSAADIAVVPSTEPEPFGMVAIEAMAASVPVIAAAHGGLLDIVQDDVTGLTFMPRNASALASSLKALADDASRRRRMGEAGREVQRQRFSARSTSDAFHAIYDGIEAARRGRSE